MEKLISEDLLKCQSIGDEYLSRAKTEGKKFKENLWKHQDIANFKTNLRSLIENNIYKSEARKHEK